MEEREYTCGNCGQKVDKHADVCPSCNAPLVNIKCQKCGYVGTKIEFSAGCPNCNRLATRRGKTPLWVQIVVWIALLGLLVVVGLGLKRTQQGVVTRGSEIPDFTLTLFKDYYYQDTPQVKLSDLRGKVVVINFWASWCKPCEGEAADLQAAWEYYQPTGKVVFLGLDYVDTEPEARSYLAKFGITFPNGPDMGTRISQLFNRNMGVPETYIIDQQGVLRVIKIGPFSSVEEIKASVDPLLVGQ